LLKNERKKMIMNKVLGYARKIGLDEDELLEMTVLEAMLKIEDARALWKDLMENGETSR